jgi:hypothetical protein
MYLVTVNDFFAADIAADGTLKTCGVASTTSQTAGSIRTAVRWQDAPDHDSSATRQRDSEDGQRHRAGALKQPEEWSCTMKSCDPLTPEST